MRRTEIMGMRKSCLMVATIAAFNVGTAARADVNYKIDVSYIDGRQTVNESADITTGSFVPDGAKYFSATESNCVVSGQVCQDVFFESGDAFFPAAIFTFTTETTQVSYSFPLGSFVTPGVYAEQSGRGTLVVKALASGVPEPATWGMMILGFGAAGYALRLRTKVRTNVSFA